MYSFNEWFNHWITDIRPMTCSPRTCRSNLNSIKRNAVPFIGPKWMEDIIPHDIDRIYQNMRDHGASDNVVYAFSTTLNQLFLSAIENGVITENPCSSSQRRTYTPVARIIYSDETMKRILDAIYYSRLRNVFRICLFNNIRIGEVLGLAWDDIDYENHIISVKRILIYNPDGGSVNNIYDKAKLYPLSEKAANALQEECRIQRAFCMAYGDRFQNSGNYVFTDYIGKQISVKMVKDEQTRMKKISGVDSFSTRVLRNQFQFKQWEEFE